MSGRSGRPARARYAVARAAGLSIRAHRRSALVTTAAVVAVLALAAHSLALGDYGLSSAEAYRRLLGDAGSGDDFLGVYFVQSVRLPRTIAGIGVGAALGLSGRLFQVVSSNALGSPDIVGFTAGSASGALVAIIVLGPTPVPYTHLTLPTKRPVLSSVGVARLRTEKK